MLQIGTQSQDMLTVTFTQREAKIIAGTTLSACLLLGARDKKEFQSSVSAHMNHCK